MYSIRSILLAAIAAGLAFGAIHLITEFIYALQAQDAYGEGFFECMAERADLNDALRFCREGRNSD